jgi:hypothetical protein
VLRTFQPLGLAGHAVVDELISPEVDHAGHHELGHIVLLQKVELLHEPVLEIGKEGVDLP